jgi:xanthine dehydrogenase YagR molybdenum-binding subunit
MHSVAGHQPATIQTIALGADKDGKLTGIRHDSISPTPVFDNYIEYAALSSRCGRPAAASRPTTRLSM